MQDLRLIGVHEDGQHVLLTDATGARFRVPLDDALRAAARRDRAHLGQLQIEIDGGLRPREVQALVRRGLSTEEVADRAGWTVEKVRRFEGPVLAEREYIARTARECAVGSRGSGPVTLTERVTERLRDRGVERGAAEWDSARDEDGIWSLTMTFPAGGRQRTASWSYEPLGGSVTATNDEARWLSEEAAPNRAIPAPHRADSSEELDVYDLDADGGIDRKAADRASQEPIDLMAAMREHSARGRRGRRRASPSHTPGDDRPRHDALPLEDLLVPVAGVEPPPAARGRNRVSQHLEEAVGDADEHVGGWPQDDVPVDGVGRDGREETTDATTSDTAPEQVEELEEVGADAAPQRERRPVPTRQTGGRKGRPSVPSWDDIVFGTRGSGPG
ncbi:MAG: septation protein SepH [Ornithinibacter sp.]